MAFPNAIPSSVLLQNPDQVQSWYWTRRQIRYSCVRRCKKNIDLLDQRPTIKIILYRKDSTPNIKMPQVDIVCIFELWPQTTVLKSSPAPRVNSFDCSLNKHEITVYYWHHHVNYIDLIKWYGIDFRGSGRLI